MGRRTSGKWKGILQGAVALIVLAIQCYNEHFPPIPYSYRISYWLLVFITGYTVFSLWEYLSGNRELLLEIRRRGRA